MFDFEGSRSEFLKILAEMGEEPAFVSRGLAPHRAMEELVAKCPAKRAELLQWPSRHFAALQQRTGGRWESLKRYLAFDAEVLHFAAIEKELSAVRDSSNPSVKSPKFAPIFATTSALLRQFTDSTERFNRDWLSFIVAELGPINELRAAYNRFYSIEKASAFGNDQVNEGFESLKLLGPGALLDQFPLIRIPVLK